LFICQHQGDLGPLHQGEGFGHVGPSIDPDAHKATDKARLVGSRVLNAIGRSYRHAISGLQAPFAECADYSGDDGIQLTIRQRTPFVTQGSLLREAFVRPHKQLLNCSHDLFLHEEFKWSG